MGDDVIEPVKDNRLGVKVGTVKIFIVEVKVEAINRGEEMLEEMLEEIEEIEGRVEKIKKIKKVVEMIEEIIEKFKKGETNDFTSKN